VASKFKKKLLPKYNKGHVVLTCYLLKDLSHILGGWDYGCFGMWLYWHGLDPAGTGHCAMMDHSKEPSGSTDV
jgi:hypothetical protein